MEKEIVVIKGDYDIDESLVLGNFDDDADKELAVSICDYGIYIVDPAEEWVRSVVENGSFGLYWGKSAIYPFDVDGDGLDELFAVVYGESFVALINACSLLS